MVRKNKDMTIEGVEKLFRKRRGEINAEICRNCIQHVVRVEEKYWVTDRITDQKMIDKCFQLVIVTMKVILGS